MYVGDNFLNLNLHFFLKYIRIETALRKKIVTQKKRSQWRGNFMKETKIEPTPSVGKSKKFYKRINLIGNILFFIIGVTVVGYDCYNNYRIKTIYNSLDMSFLSARVVEYGTVDYDTRGFIENIDDGVIRDYTKYIDTSTVGVQNLNYEIGKADVVKTFNTEIEVVDTKMPIIEFEKDTIYIYVNNDYDVSKNITSVRDEVDGDIPYSSEYKEEKKNYYVIENNLNKDSIGSYEIKVVAYDKNGNETTGSYKINVIARPVIKTYTYSGGGYNGSASIDTSSVVATARSLLGYRYVYAGESPSVGFDCSGLVKYVFGLQGKYLGHGTMAQSYAGYEVSRGDMQPGDIILWSTYSNNYPTHSAIYVGGDQMIHAANYSTGVIQSSVSYWESHGGGHIATIRRV